MASTASTARTSVVLNSTDVVPPQRTYVVFGLERGGTSAIAGVMRALGLYLGEINEGNNEDQAFHNRGLGSMRQTIARRNEQFDVWGWKYPLAVNYLPVLVRSLRAPMFVVVYRDVVATALSRAQWDGQGLRRAPRMALHEANVVTNANTSFALATGRPVLMVSNEKVDRHPAEMIDEIADFLGVPRPDDEFRQRILDYIAPGSYKIFDEFFADVTTIGAVPMLDDDDEVDMIPVGAGGAPLS